MEIFKDQNNSIWTLKEEIYKNEKTLSLSGEKGTFYLGKKVIKKLLLDRFRLFLRKKSQITLDYFYDLNCRSCFINIHFNLLKIGYCEEEIIHVTGGEIIHTDILNLNRQTVSEMVIYVESFLNDKI